MVAGWMCRSFAAATERSRKERRRTWGHGALVVERR